ncbi:thiamine pyrophosphate-binding protein [Gordonia neofelifaecis]|uniref:acetolactate synthase n=1 Tax=Gordonia neofelifaecis NRRL B-59395 TaxID=644548 RepID=F1YJ18_9ACTN|nr:thiamine pyrophosphate-binding protein [Gordonia neofelifaecis]EGD55476.1 thiamine pyrophosphate protein domain-containing protein TPP-binding protein [Gordonia neofelifaecis NRRL B-59395]
MSAVLSTGGRAVVDALVAHGVDTVFGIPGTHNLAIYAAMQASPINHVTPRHEQGAGYAADGYARLSGRPGVVVTTTGPAILNAAASAAQAYSDSVPVLFIAPGMPSDHPSGYNGLLHEVRSQIDAMSAVVAHAQRVTSVAEIPHAVAQCFAAMTTGRPRPAYLEIPLDLLEAEASVVPEAPVVAPSIVPAESVVAAAAELIGTAQRPLIVAGGGASRASAEVLAFAEKIDAPVVTTANGKAVVREDHPLALGAGVQLSSTLDLVRDCDVVVAVGTELAPADWWWGPMPETRLVRIDIDPLAVATNAIPEVAVVGDAASVLADLTARIAAAAGRAESGADRAAAWRATLTADARRLGAAYVGLAESLAEVLDDEAVIVADQSMSCYYGLMGNLPRYAPRSFMYPAGLGTLGYSLPAGIGAMLAEPGRQVVAVLGDGGVMFSLAELATAAHAGVALPVVVVDNGGYGEIRNEMLERDETPLSVDLPTPDFVGVARALGCEGVDAASYAEVGPAVRKAFSADRPTLIYVREPAV